MFKSQISAQFAVALQDIFMIYLCLKRMIEIL